MMGLHIEILEVGPSLGEVAGFISGGLSLAHQALPLALATILIALVYKRDYNAATWSAIARHIQKSILPTLIRADGGISSLLSPSVFSICCLSIIVAILIPVASFLTPIPLTDKLVAADGAKVVDFKYVPDLSFYGQGTPPRPADPIKRACDHGAVWGDCPDSVYTDPTVRNQYPGHIVVNSTIPDITSQPFQSSSQPRTVAGPLQIQYRKWYEGNNSYIDNFAQRLVGSPRPIQSYVLEDGYHLVEGLIIDTTNGGIGFRNHTIPIDTTLGAEWEEDILWVSPATACSRTNLSFHFSISSNSVSQSNYGYLQNDGGFDVLGQDPPSPRWDDNDDVEHNWRAIGYPPDLQDRAELTAFWNNRLIAEQMGVNSSVVGQTYYDELKNYGGLASPSSLVINDMNGMFLESNFYPTTNSNTAMFEAYGYRCTGYDDNNPSTPEKAYVRCGYLFSVPVPLDAQASYSPTSRTDLGSNWTQQLYTCASSTTASVKTVSFRFNGTDALEGLTVLDVKAKDYSDTALPRWGIENAWGFGIADINLFWGLVGDDVVSDTGLTVYEAEEIFLPASSRYNDFSDIYDTFAAGGAFGAAWNSVYGAAAVLKGSSLHFIPSYSGESNYALTLKWRQLSQTAQGAVTILNLIWTDLIATAVVGTVTGFEDQVDQQPLKKRSSGMTTLGRRAVHLLIHKVGYSNIYYAIPAFILGGILVLTVIVCFVFLILGRLSLRRLEYYTNQTSLGRALTQVQHPQAAEPEATSKEWKKKAGRLIIHVPRLPRRRVQARKSLLSSGSSLRTQASAQSFVMSNLGGAGNTRYEPVHAREPF